MGSPKTKQLLVSLPIDAYQELERSAIAALRDPDQQAAYLVRRALDAQGHFGGVEAVSGPADRTRHRAPDVE
jgi:hypothetical protein